MRVSSSKSQVSGKGLAASELVQMDEVCPRCAGAMYLHPSGRVCGCVDCLSVYNVTSEALVFSPDEDVLA